MELRVRGRGRLQSDDGQINVKLWTVLTAKKERHMSLGGCLSGSLDTGQGVDLRSPALWRSDFGALIQKPERGEGVIRMCGQWEHRAGKNLLGPQELMGEEWWEARRG